MEPLHSKIKTIPECKALMQLQNHHKIKLCQLPKRWEEIQKIVTSNHTIMFLNNKNQHKSTTQRILLKYHLNQLFIVKTFRMFQAISN